MARQHRLARSIAIAVVMAGATVLVAVNFTDLSTLDEVLEKGSAPWIAAAIAVHLVYFIAYAALYRLAFAVVGVTSRTRSLIPVLLAALFVNVVVPTGAGAAAVFIDDAVRRGEDGARAAVGVVVVLLLDLLTLIPFVAWGVWFLAAGGLSTGWELAGLALFVVYLIVLVLALALARWRRAWVTRVLGGIRRAAARIAGWFHARPPVAEDWPARTATQLAEAAAALGARPRLLAGAALWAVVLHLINLVSLWMFVRGFGTSVPFGGLIAAFALGIVFFVVVIVPQAAPIVEATMMAIFIEAGGEPGRIVAATLAFRLVNFWLPLVLGLGFAWWLGRRGGRARAPGGAP